MAGRPHRGNDAPEPPSMQGRVRGFFVLGRGALPARAIPLGILYSVTGTYGLIGQACLDGARLGQEQVNADPRYSFTFRAAFVDPVASKPNYHAPSEAML